MMGTAIGLSAAQAGSQYQSQSQAASAQKDYQKAQVNLREQQYQQNYDRVIDSYRLQRVSEQVRLDEVRRSATLQASNINRSALEQRSAAAAEAASRGSAGQSQIINLMSYLTRAGQGVSAVQSQFQAEAQQSNRNQQAFSIEARNRIASVQPYSPAPVQGPSPIAPFLQIGAGALNAYTTYGLPYQQASSQTATTPSASSYRAPALGLKGPGGTLGGGV